MRISTTSGLLMLCLLALSGCSGTSTVTVPATEATDENPTYQVAATRSCDCRAETLVKNITFTDPNTNQQVTLVGASGFGTGTTDSTVTSTARGSATFIAPGGRDRRRFNAIQCSSNTAFLQFFSGPNTIDYTLQMSDFISNDVVVLSDDQGNVICQGILPNGSIAITDLPDCQP